jgi:3-deoxy-D-manno-octulosonic-acid transferase
MFAELDLVVAQTEEFADRFQQLGTPGEKIHVAGSLKFDGARSDRANDSTLRLAQLAGLAADDMVFLAGSTQSPEETYALRIFQTLAPRFPRLRLILVPRHPERFTEVAKVLETSGVAWARRSELTTISPKSVKVILVDAVGELGAWWGTADIAFVGGSMGKRGGQNMIEPAAYGVATSFGPNTWNFRDVVARFLAANAAVVVQNESELAAFVERCLSDDNYRTTLGNRAAQLVQQQQGATEATLRYLAPCLAAKAMTSQVDTQHPIPKAHTAWQPAGKFSSR